MINFVMISIQNSRIRADQINKGFLRFLKTKDDIFHALGIPFVIPTSGTLDSRMEQVQAQIGELDEDKKRIFDQLKLLYENEKLAGASMSDAARAEETKKQEERSKLAEEAANKKREDLMKLQEMVNAGGDDIDINMDIDNMPDCRLKYDIIVKRSKANGAKFEDKQFPAGDEALGEKVLNDGLGGQSPEWKRMGENQTVGGQAHVVFEDGVDSTDVHQGYLGDCYFLSALAVLGSKLTRDKFIFLNTDDEFNTCGAFCIKFYEQGVEDIIIVDDFMPLLGGTTFPFMKTEPTGQACKELWPIILEKAYAKKYGSYANIEGGLVDFALAEMTNGIPVSMERQDNPNLEKWWNEIYQMYKGGNVFLGAGSPANVDGDTALSPMGIFQSHAYSILKLIEVDGLKLMCIRNPHGQGEWTGDWADDSELWTNRMKNQTGQKEFLDDGIFWMDFNDFVDEFDTVYACRVYNEENGWCTTLTDGKWEGEYAEGVPTKDNKNAKLEMNPNFGLTIQKPGKGFLVMRLKEKTSPHMSKQAGLLVMQANQGQVIKSLRKTK